jgi:mannose-6-phosphate isomerase
MIAHLNCGGVFISRPALPIDGGGSVCLGEMPYKYHLVSLRAGEVLQENMLSTYCIFVLDAHSGSLDVNGFNLINEQYVVGDSSSLSVSAHLADVLFLMVAQPIQSVLNSLQRKKLYQAKTVEKPWGYEKWLTAEGSSPFVFKKIHIKSGFKTSLQYHAIKRETNLVYKGHAKLHHQSNEALYSGSFVLADLRKISLVGPFVADIFPGRIHRLEALKDLEVYEVSTPELDDVIRISDDTSRGNGRIESEHSRNE